MALPGPLVFLLLGGGAYLLLSKKSTPAGGGQAATPAQPGAINIPPSVLTTHPDVEPENTPSVTVQIPTPGYTTAPVPAGGYATGDKSDQPLPGITLPTVTPGATPQQVITQALPNLISQATSAIPAGIPTSLPTSIPSLPSVTPATPLQTHETTPALDPHGTVALAKDMIDAESMAGWKAALSSRISAWQRAMGLTADGKFGPSSAYKMALEVGILPLVRYWPQLTQLKDDLQKYRDTLFTMAANADDNRNPALAAALRSSAAYESGIAYTGTPKAVPSSARLAQATALKNALGAK